MNMHEKYKKSMENGAPRQTFYIPVSIGIVGNVTKVEVERLVFEAIQNQYLKGFNFKDENAVAVELNVMAPEPAKKVFS